MKNILFSSAFPGLADGGRIVRQPAPDLVISQPERLSRVYADLFRSGVSMQVTIPLSFGAERREPALPERRGVCLSAELARSSSDGALPVWGQCLVKGVDVEHCQGEAMACLSQFFTSALSIFGEAGCAGVFLVTDDPFLPVRLFVSSCRSAGLTRRAVIFESSLVEGGEQLDPAIVSTAVSGHALSFCLYGLSFRHSAAENMDAYRRFRVKVTGTPHGFIMPASFDESHLSAYGEMYRSTGASIVGLGDNSPSLLTRLRSFTAGEVSTAEQAPRQVLLCSSRRVVTVGPTAPFTIIGERINPSGRKRLAKRIRDRDWSFVLEIALEQERAGAHIIDVNIGLPDIDETESLRQLIPRLDRQVASPLSIDTSDRRAMVTAALHVQGRPLLNSTTAEAERLEGMLECAREAGAALVVMTMDERGIPTTAAERIAIVERVLRLAETYDLGPADLLFDCLVLSAAAQQDQVLETLNAVRILGRDYHAVTILGISNISFGLPARPLINRTFLAMAMAAGLDCAIIDPRHEDIRDVILAASVLVGRDTDARSFVRQFGEQPDRVETADGDISPTASPEDGVRGLMEQLGTALENGERDRVIQFSRQLVETGMIVGRVLDEALIPAIQNVGDRFGRGELFLPQLMRAAESMKAAFFALGLDRKDSGETVSGNDRRTGRRVLLATVQGDMHDLGKNLVATFLTSHGYEVHDLGKNASTTAIMDEIRASDIEFVGLSALMTSTLPHMQKTVADLKQQFPQVKIIIGGAVVTQDFADRIGADAYGRHAAEAASLIERLSRNSPSETIRS